jgi:hypothetical protein
MTNKEIFIASYFDGFHKLTGVSLEEFSAYYDESIYSGFPNTAGGSVMESEGKSIYVLIRILKPKRILEIGNLRGESSNHILQAVENNKSGEVALLDVAESLQYDKLHNRNFVRVLDDSVNYLQQPIDFDFIVHDSEHGYVHTKKEIALVLKNNQAKKYTIWAHDYYSTAINSYIQVQAAYDESKGSFDQFEPFKETSEYPVCGFLITQKINTNE